MERQIHRNAYGSAHTALDAQQGLRANWAHVIEKQYWSPNSRV